MALSWWGPRHGDVEADPADKMSESKTREAKLNMRIDVETIDVDWRSTALGSSGGSGSSLSSEPPPSPGGPICCDAGAAPIDAAPAAAPRATRTSARSASRARSTTLRC